jgi:AcrR family transcriptional regulator
MEIVNADTSSARRLTASGPIGPLSMSAPLLTEPEIQASRKRRLNPQDWVKAALDLLVEEGIEGVRVDTLARKLGVTKGSFYWHFKTRDELLDALADSWGETEGESFMTEVMALPGDPRSKLALLGAIYLRENYPAYERAMRGWALTDPRAVDALKKAGVRTMRTLVLLYRELGFDPAEAEFRARIHRLSGIGTLFALEFDMDSMVEPERSSQRERFLDLMTKTATKRERSIAS